MLCGITLGTILVSTMACAGYGRGGSSGFSSRGSSSGYSSRSYVPPSYRSSPVVNRTVYKTVHVAAPAASASSGMHPMVAGMAGYLVGDALNRHTQGQAQAPQQVVYANPIPQQPQTQPQAQQEVPGQQFQAPVQYVNAGQQKEDSSLGLIECLFSLIVFTLVCVLIGKYISRRL